MTTQTPSSPSTLERIRARKARVGVIGLGYVGLPLAVEFAHAVFDVTGFDVDAIKSDQINAGRSYIPDVAEADLAACVRAGTLRATTDMTALGTMDAIDICVPTPLRKTKDPDLSYIVLAVEAVAATLKRGQLVILESTTYPGTTDEVVQPMLEAQGLVADVDFFLAFSPERVDPGNQQFNTKNIPKIVGGVGPASTEVAAALYGATVQHVVPVSSSMPHFVVDRVAEALNSRKKAINGSRIHLVGVAYKRDVNDMRESPALDVLELLAKRGAELSYSDPFVPEVKYDGRLLASIDLAAAVAQRTLDCAVICTDHTGLDYDALVDSGKLVVDTRNALKARQGPTIFRL